MAYNTQPLQGVLDRAAWLTWGTSKLKVTRPRLRNRAGEVVLPGYAALACNADLSRRIADVLTRSNLQLPTGHRLDLASDH